MLPYIALTLYRTHAEILFIFFFFKKKLYFRLQIKVKE